MTDPDPVAALAAQLAELRGVVKKLRGDLASAIGRNRLRPPPAPWWGGSEAERRQMLAELREWVETFLRPHYPDYLTRLPGCWANHMEAVWELSTLRAEWIRIYGDEDNRDLQGALNWHDRYLPDVIKRLAEAIRCDETGCRITRRRP